MYPEPGGVPVTTAGTGLPAHAVAQALSAGWRSQRPEDRLALLPMADGAAGSAAVFPSSLVTGRLAVQASGPLGQVREVDLLRLAPPQAKRPSDAAAPSSGSGTTWFLDAARLTALPADREEAAREAMEGTTYGLGQVLAAAVRASAPDDLLVVGLARSGVHDGGAGLVDGLGGVEQAARMLAERRLLLALADDVPLGGLSGAGQGLVSVTSLGAEQAQERDRDACAAASSLLTQLTERSGSVGRCAGSCQWLEPKERTGHAQRHLMGQWGRRWGCPPPPGARRAGDARHASDGGPARPGGEGGGR